MIYFRSERPKSRSPVKTALYVATDLRMTTYSHDLISHPIAPNVGHLEFLYFAKILVLDERIFIAILVTQRKAVHTVSYV